MTTLAIMLGLLVTPLLIGTVLNRVAGRTVANVHLLGCIGIALVFGFTGMGHFILYRADGQDAAPVGARPHPACLCNRRP